MILGIGTDLCEIKRIEVMLRRHGARALKRLLTPSERERVHTHPHPAAYVAKRFAAKEALVKALGIGFRGGISFQDMEILNDAYGAPLVRLSGAVQNNLASRISPHQSAHIHLSLSDGKDHALAFVVIERQSA
ncbi:MAG: holo-ACP synthase [Holosporales bacterium]